MEKLSKKEEKSPEELKEIASSWLKGFESSLNDVLKDKDKNLDDIVEVILEKGVLDRAAPIDGKIREARHKLGKFVLDIDRDDPELYWRIFYGAANVIDSAKRNYSRIADKVVAPVISMAFGKVSSETIQKDQKDQKDRYFKFFPTEEDQKEPFSVIARKIIERAKLELEKRRVIPHKDFIPREAEGIYKGIPVIIDYSFDGRIHLNAKDLEDHIRLGGVGDFGNVSPSELNPEDFKLPEKNK